MKQNRFRNTRSIVYSLFMKVQYMFCNAEKLHMLWFLSGIGTFDTLRYYFCTSERKTLLFIFISSHLYTGENEKCNFVIF